jgi:hypothetical protein
MPSRTKKKGRRWISGPKVGHTSFKRERRRATDIVGTYTAVSVGAAANGGVSSIRLQNARGVVLDLRGRNIGLELNANVSGIEVGLR